MLELFLVFTLYVKAIFNIIIINQRETIAMTSKKKKSVILFNATGLTGVQKNDLTHMVAKQCRHDNYVVSRIFYYKDYCHHSVLYKLAEFVSRTRDKVTVIFANDTYESKASNSQLIYAVLSTLSIAGHIELCLYAVEDRTPRL